MDHSTEENKRNAVDFYRMAYLGQPEKAVTQYVGKEYIQHNPSVSDGKKGFITYFEEMSRDYPHKDIHFLRVIAEADLVALHTRQIWPEGDEYVTMDFFRFNDNGKIVEHWDAIQNVPKDAKNTNTMF